MTLKQIAGKFGKKMSPPFSWTGLSEDKSTDLGGHEYFIR